MIGFLASLADHWQMIVVVVVCSATIAYAAFVLRNWKLALIALILFGWFYDRQGQYASGYNARVAFEVAEQTKTLKERIATLEQTAAEDKARADVDALAIEALEERANQTPTNAKAALPAAAVKRIMEIR